MEKRIAISCSALARIMINGKYLLVVEEGVSKPIGGALRFTDESKPFLEAIDYNTDRMDDDLRIDIPENVYGIFKSWHEKFIERETTVRREVMEELQPFIQIDISHMIEKCIRTTETVEDTGTSSMDLAYKNRLFQIHTVDFSNQVIEEIKSAVLTGTDLVLVTKEQIINEENNISYHTKHIL